MQEVDQILAKYSGAASRLPPRKSSVQGEIPSRSLQVGDVHGMSSRKLDVRNYQVQPSVQNTENQQQNDVSASLTLQDVGAPSAVAKREQVLLRDVMEQSVTALALENQAVPVAPALWAGQAGQQLSKQGQAQGTPNKVTINVPQTPQKQQKIECSNSQNDHQCNICGFVTNCLGCKFCGHCGAQLDNQQPLNVESRENQQYDTIQKNQVELWDTVGELRGQVCSLHLELLKIADDQRKWAESIKSTLSDVKQMLQCSPGTF